MPPPHLFSEHVTHHGTLQMDSQTIRLDMTPVELPNIHKMWCRYSTYRQHL